VPRRRPDPSELAYERLRRASEPAVPLPPQLHRWPRKKVYVYVFLFLVVVLLLSGGLGAPPPDAGGSCSRPAFAFSTGQVREGGAVKWSVDGPDGTRVVITGGSEDPARGRLLGPLPLRDCTAEGVFGAALPEGRHTVRVFLLHPDGSHTVVGQKVLTVNAP
jgi:hypothetical protein